MVALALFLKFYDMARKIKERKLKSPTITIIGEGATERHYFTHLKRLNSYNYICKKFSSPNYDVRSAVVVSNGYYVPFLT